MRRYETTKCGFIFSVNDNDIDCINEKPYAKVKVNTGWLYISFYTGDSFGESLTHANLIENLQGVQIRYTEEHDIEVFKTLTTSVLLDPNEDLSDHNYALKPGEEFEIYGVRLENVNLSDGLATLDVNYVD